MVSYPNAHRARNKWVELVALAGDHKASLITVTEIWLFDGDYTPRVVLEKFIVCKQDGEKRISARKVAVLVREVINHLESGFFLCIRDVYVCTLTLTFKREWSTWSGCIAVQVRGLRKTELIQPLAGVITVLVKLLIEMTSNYRTSTGKLRHV